MAWYLDISLGDYSLQPGYVLGKSRNEPTD